ncbi:carbonic anhydrase 3-like isoform X1 [Penaeus monodon]|uniref:carbonic anhydrase 3-like isoform X1 n=2 Tax=Penaeus monodon TaxID=6687 RepID=UPI0018A73253|nr:carbonic anhydrase 3-like isoform X1 [Penaeus monodon]
MKLKVERMASLNVLLTLALILEVWVYAIPLGEPSPSGGLAGNPVWSYEGNSGPAFWHEAFPRCGGENQSPVDLKIEDTTHWSGRLPFTFGRYNVSPPDVTVKNNGHTVVATWTTKDMDKLPFIKGGGLEGVYVFSNFHFHWGSDDSKGSEHTFDGDRYAAELHLVHFKKDYGTLSKALKHKDGVVVLGVMVEADDNDNERLQPFVDALEEVVELGTEFHPDYNIPLDALLPEEEDRHLFFRYQGSLTTPLCNEVVTWTLFQTPIALSSNQLAQFRALIGHDGLHHLQDNFRPVQPLNGREVAFVDTGSY